jgi:hypothetical protein
LNASLEAGSLVGAELRSAPTSGIIKYRDEETDQAVRLEEWLR